MVKTCAREGCGVEFEAINPRKEFCARKCAKHDYRHRPEVKARALASKRSRRKRPESKAKRKDYQRTYYQRPGVKDRVLANQRAYRQRPEVKARIKAGQPPHRVIMAKKIGRPLEPWETVHHMNGIHHDNRLKNLEIRPVNNHPKGGDLDASIAFWLERLAAYGEVTFEPHAWVTEQCSK